MVEEKTEGQGGGVGQQHPQEHGTEQHQRIKTNTGQIQPVVPTMHGAGVKPHQQGGKGYQAICVVPVREGNHPQQHDRPGLGNRSALT